MRLETIGPTSDQAGTAIKGASQNPQLRLFSGWSVAGLLALHLVTLTLVHYVAGPLLGMSPASPELIAMTIALAGVVIISLTARDLLSADRR
jgi:hypothetical protein